jgi:hypothetical protein
MSVDREPPDAALVGRPTGRRGEPDPKATGSPGISDQLQPLVEPQDGQAWHEPARCICTPHCMQ